MQEVNTDVKGQLAKLLATENLHVEHRKIATAYFDVQKRVLALPIWKDVSNDVYDLLVGPEVGHALYTPADCFGDAPKDFVNVIEDVRIEKKMKVTYPGLRKSFYTGYTELHDKDFFGVRKEDPARLPFIDRINLHYKIGSHQEIKFTEEEQVWVDRAGKTNTFEDVVKLANELYEYCEGLQKEKEKEQLPDVPPMGAGSLPDEIKQEIEENAEYEPCSPDPTSEEKGEGQTPEASDEGGEDIEAPVNGAGEDYDETESHTDKAMAEAQQQLVDDSAKEWVYVDLPKVKVENIVVPYKKILEDLHYHFLGQAHVDQNAQEYYDKNLRYNFSKFTEFKKSSVKTVNYLVKQFEMKKSAANYQRAATSKTGVINTNSLYKYKISEDIFKRVTTVADGKNHGLIMHLDWSGSMTTTTPSGTLLTDTLKQTFNLIWFCKKVNIPFRVYAFSNGWGGGEKVETYVEKENTLSLTDSFQLFEFFSNKMNNRDLELMMKYIWTQAWGMRYSWGCRPMQKYSLGGTPLADAVICTRALVNKFKAIEKVDKVNVVVLSDGDSNPMSYLTKCDWADREFRSAYLQNSHNKVFILRDKETGLSKKINTTYSLTTREIVGFVNQVTDYNWIGIRIGDKGDMNRILRQADISWSDQQDYNKQWSKQKFVSTDKYGYSELLILGSSNVGGDTNDLDVKVKGETATAGELTRAFKKHMGSKMTNKLILNKFVEQIA